MINGMVVDLMFHISKILDLVHGPMLLMKSETHKHLQTLVIIWLYMVKFFMDVTFMVPPLRVVEYREAIFCEAPTCTLLGSLPLLIF